MIAKIKNRTDEEKDKLFIGFFMFCFIILTFPRSLDTILPKAYDFINILKILIFFSVVLITIKNKIKLSKLTKNIIIYSTYLLIVTLINKVPIMVFLKVYFLNVGMLLFCEVLFNSKYKEKFIENFSNYFLILLIINFIGIIIGFICKNPQAYLTPNSETYFLGQDNRFILYIIPTIIGYYYMFERFHNKKYLKLLVTTYLIGLISLISLWSAAAFCVLLLVALAIVASKFIRKKVNIYGISIALLMVCSAIVFFKIQNIFEFLIVDILHKSLDLSYRTILWDDAIEMLKNSPLNLIFGFGYFDTKQIFTNIPVRVGHLHNILVNSLFFSGIIGTVIYFRNFYLVENKINKIHNVKQSNRLSIILLSILILMLFDTFELYQIYYFTLFLLFKCNEFLNDNKKDNNTENEEYQMESQTDKVGIMLATYNGEKYIKDQIDSIINQTYKNWVLYISDDNSSDNTISIVNEYKERYKDKIIILENENKFSNAKLNFANLFDKVDGMDYYMFCDQDDVWTKDKIQNLLIPVKKEEKDGKKPILAYCDSKIVDSNLNVISESLVEYGNKHLPNKHLMEHVLIENYFPGCAVLFNKELKEKTKTIYKDCEMHDWWLTLTSALSGKIIFVDKKLHYYRQHGNNTVGAHKDDNAVNKIIIRIKKLFDLKTTKTTWSTYQDTVLKQANELYRIYSKDETIDSNNIEIIKKFIDIMNDKNRLRRLILLIKKNYVPVEKIRVLRLVL